MQRITLGTVFLFLLLPDYGQTLLDTEGTRFFWNYIRNANPNTTLPNQQLSITVLNGGTVPCDFTLIYRTALLPKNLPFNTSTITAPPQGFVNFPIPAIYGYAYDAEGVQSSNNPTLTLNANATCPVTLIAHNVDSVTQQGDSFMVLPAQWSSYYYSFTLPQAQTTDYQYEIVTLIPTEKDATVTLTIGAHHPVSFNVTYGDESLSYYGEATKDKEVKTYQVESSAPIQVVAGVTCVGVYNGPCDHVAFMPQPLPAQDCYSQPWQDDDHVTDLVTASNFFVDIPNTCNQDQTVFVDTTGGRPNKELTISPHTTNTEQTYDINKDGRAVYFHAETSAVHVTRLLDMSPKGGQGAFMTVVPSLTQFLNVPSYFYTIGENDAIEIICDSTMSIVLQVDGVNVFTARDNTTYPWDKIVVDGTMNYYSYSFPVKGSGYHSITFSNPPRMGSYGYYVYGTGALKYGYTGHVMKPAIVPIPSPTPQPTWTPATTKSTTPTPAGTTKTPAPPASTTVPVVVTTSAGPSKAPVTTPTTAVPITPGPSTVTPSVAPSTATPSTAAPSTANPSTAAQSTATPSTAAPPPTTTVAPVITTVTVPVTTTTQTTPTTTTVTTTTTPPSTITTTTAAPSTSTAAPSTSTTVPSSSTTAPVTSTSTVTSSTSTVTPSTTTVAPPPPTTTPPYKSAPTAIGGTVLTIILTLMVL